MVRPNRWTLCAQSQSPNITHTGQDRLWTFRQTLRRLDNDQLPRGGSYLSLYLEPYRNVMQIEGRDYITRREGESIRFECLNVVKGGDLLYETPHDVSIPSSLPEDSQVTWNLQVSVFGVSKKAGGRSPESTRGVEPSISNT